MQTATPEPPRADARLFRGLPPTVGWVGGDDGALHLLDQTLLPNRIEVITCSSAEAVWEAIRSLRVRGAPAIGVAAAYGLCLGTRQSSALSLPEFATRVEEVAQYLNSARPTAVNLAWAVRRTQAAAVRGGGDARRMWRSMLKEAHAIAREDAEICRRIGENGARLVPDGGGVLTHCNAGALATVAYGTALSLLYVAHEQGKRFRVYADETRPLLQGSRLTAMELAAAGLDVTVLCDGAAAALMSTGRVQMVVVGADRIATNGDTANKIGTYGLAIAARRHGIAFYVAAPTSTFDLSLADGRRIPIEERGSEEVSHFGGVRITPSGVRTYNPAFDVTPAELISGIVTEKGVVEPVSAENLGKIVVR